jgi:hypothetical protein
MAQTQFDAQAAVQDAVSAWAHVAPIFIVPTNDEEFDRLRAVITQLAMRVTSEDHPLANLLHVLGTLALEYEQAHDPDA